MEETINGYVLEEPLKTDNSGFSRWGFAKKGYRDYFIKEFLSPVYPVNAALLGPELTEQKRQICRKFTYQKQLLFQCLGEASDGNLIRIEEFFRYKTKFYVTMQKVEAVTMLEMLKEPLERRVMICMSLAHAIRGLHQRGLVHGDIKLNNVVFCKNGDGGIGVRVIDVDSCFWEKDPPGSEEEINGDQIYMAPETFQRMAFSQGVLDRKVDVYALGLLFHQILTGDLPEFDGDAYHYAYEALLDGKELGISAKISPGTAELLSSMLQAQPERRPELQDVYLKLQRRYGEMTGMTGGAAPERAVEVPRGDAGAAAHPADLRGRTREPIREEGRREEDFFGVPLDDDL